MIGVEIIPLIHYINRELIGTDDLSYNRLEVVTSMKTLILSARDLKELVGMEESINVVEEHFKAYRTNSTRICSKHILDVPDVGDIRFMTADDDSFVNAKVIGAVDRKAEEGVKMGGVCILFDRDSMKTLCLADAEYVTNLRTGAAGAIAAKYLARKEVSRIGIVGAGNQGYYQLKGLECIYGDSLENVCIFDIDMEKMRSFRRKMGHKATYFVNLARSVVDCVQDVDILVTATPSTTPIIWKKWLKPGVHINAIGSDTSGKQELDPKILSVARIVVDDLYQAQKCGEINVPIREGVISIDDIYASLSEIIRSEKKGRENPREITIFDSTGLAIQDLAIVRLAFEKAISLAKEKGKQLGVLFDFGVSRD